MNEIAHPQPATRRARAPRPARAFWWRQLHLWHWISSAASLIGLLLFAATGITLNHAADIEASPVVVEKSATLPPALLPAIAPDAAANGNRPLPPEVAQWVAREFDIATRAPAEWSADEVYLAAPRPGGDGWVAIDRATGAVTSERTDRGWIAWLNDLHKGRNSGVVWSWFIDIFSVACFVFALTGLALLWLHSKRRPSTWPLVAAGLILPAILAIFFIH
ncbi:PepSY-associated TM helix domain-containing protein [Sphingomonas baiyangensis]|uniref:PepSY-associated TM helix domain-containing protein n=1 Tax=Sphingomonas baiyangensis TaxID=2572576 RepID=A0A4U1L6P6_9SPHN|nr:PepSY-associated TM helix domain-containing protein [Sphingomonas baiyangensis]TKD51985.1 hypothetical protein FBR43_15495 [Sphingomonas baiyangensis]